ncbi:MAG: hypothetical protein K9H64_00685 [Bacteroidales bacterium]|nr:hypothetical protein [Bacteroidales bacterium]MCF8457579.1 hypothetical protein [Bacteroidales bacterium]
MKTNQFRILWLTGLICFAVNAFSQNVIYLKNGDEIHAGKYKPAPAGKLKYKAENNPGGDYQLIGQSEIFYIKGKQKKGYAFHETGMIFKIKNVDQLNEMELRGTLDACSYYHYSGTYWGTFIPTFIAVPAGLVTTVIVASIKPNRTLNLPDNANVNNEVYLQAYKDQAHKCKKQIAWKGFFIGWGMAISVGSLVGAL